MKKWLISLTMLCLCQLTMLAQANFGTDEEYNPSSPGHPQEPSIAKLYTLKTQVSPSDAGYISNGGEMQLKADTTIWLGTYRNQDYYHFLHWEQDGEVISTEEWFNYVMPAKDVVLTAVYEYNPDSPAHPDSVSFVHDLTVICTPSDAGSANYTSNRLREGESVDLWVNVNGFHRFVGWRVDGVIVSTEHSYRFVMGDHDTEVYAVFEYNPDGPGSPSANMWDEATGTVLVEEFTSGNLSNAVNNIVKGNRDAVKKVIVYGSLQSSDLSFLGNYPNCEVLDLSRTSGFSTISGYTFYFHSNLTSVVLPACVNNIEWGAFYGCSKLKEITCLATIPPTCNNSSFSQIATGAKLYVTYKSIIAYQKAEGWKSFDIYPLPGEKALFAVNYTLDGKAWRTDSVEYRTKITLPEMEAKEGHTFSGWANVPATMPAEDVTLDGYYIVNKYNLVYKVDGVEYKNTSVEYASAITPEADPVKVGHTFSGWSEIPATMPAKDVTITGSFTVNRYEIAYEIEGEIYRRDTLAYGSSITTAEAPAKEGYSFSGWGGVPATMPAKNLVLSGSYTINQYTLTYMVDNVEYKKLTLDYASAITAEAEPTKEGHTFSGWSEIPTTMPAKDVVITGIFTANKYAVIYTLDGEAFRTDSVTYGTAITLAEAPAKEGYTFAGWSEVPAAMPANDVTVTGTYTINQYTLTYMVDGLEYKKVTLDYASAITAETEPAKKGHTFSGWSEIPATMPAKDVTVVGEFSVNSYQVTYMLDGKVFKTEQVVYDTAINLPEAPAKEGYTFAGWSEVPAAMPANDVTVTGTYTVNQYTLTYIVDGIEYKKVTLDYASAITAETEPTKEGHTFSGWSEIPTTMPAKDVTVVGEFSVNSYQVTYMLDGKVFKTEQVVYGSPVPTPEVPAKPGYNFSGWGDVPVTMPAKDLTFTGNYTINKDNKYNVIYMVNGVEFKRVQYAFEDAIVPEAEPTKEGYTFSGWSEIPATMPAKDVTVVGEFGVNSYQVTYMLDGKVFKTEQVVYATTINTPEAPAKEGHTFAGWSEVPAAMPANDVTMTGTYTVNQYTLTYLVDGIEYKKVALEYASAITAEAEPTKEGHTFSGWSEIPATMPAKDVTVVGEFGVNSYQVTYMLDGKVFKTEQVVYATTINIPEAPAKEGHTFAGWSEVPAAMPANDVTVTGTYTVNQYTLTYLVDGIEYKKVILDYASAITAETEPAKEGHTFSGWSEIPATMPAKDVTVVGEFSVNSYQVTYMFDGKVFKTEQVVYGSPVPTPEVPAKPGYNFSGWGDVPVTMPAKDLTFTGNYTINKDNKYNVIYMVDGVEFKRVQYAFQDAIVPETEPTKEGYTFSGWSEIPATMPLHDVTVVGEFTVNMYQITYMVDGEVYATEQIAYGSAIVLKDAPVKEGYIFSGWSAAPETMPAKDIEVTGSYTVDGIDAVITSNLVDVYTLQGVMVKRQIPVETLEQELPGGIYIVNGKKMVIR